MENINFVAIDFETATSNTACQIGIAVVRKGLLLLLFRDTGDGNRSLFAYNAKQ